MSAPDTVTIFHNPRCSKSRGALELLQSRGIEPEVIRYLDTPPTAAELARLLALLGLSARALLRSGEAEFQTLGLNNPQLSEAELIDAMVAHPKLIERPIIVYRNRAVIGRPPERVLELFS